MNPQVSNPNDYKVVDFTNKCNFVFTPEMGCMFNGSPIFGISGVGGINVGESLKLPYHVAQQLAINLAKVSMTRGAPVLDATGVPTGVPLWNSDKLELFKNSFLTDLYTEIRPVAQTETERLMQMVKDLNKVVEGLTGNKTSPEAVTTSEKVFSDKQDVIAELEKLEVKHDKRKSKEELMKLLPSA